MIARNGRFLSSQDDRQGELPIRTIADTGNTGKTWGIGCFRLASVDVG
jgi:hypothetical protein